MRIFSRTTTARLLAVVRALSDFAARHPWLLATLFVVAYGWKTTDEPEFRRIAAAPFQNSLPPDHQFLYGSPLPFFIASYYQHHGVTPGAAFFIVQVVGWALFVAGLTRALGATLDAPARRTAMVVLFSSPLLLVLTAFVGKSDAFLVGFFLLLTATDSSVSAALLAGFMALCHAELAVAMLIAYLCLEARRWRPITAGAAAATALVLAYTHLLLSTPAESRSAYALAHAAEFLRAAAHHPILHAVGTFGPFWIYVLTRRKLSVGAVTAAVWALGLALITADFTRVFVLVSVPLLLALATEAANDLHRQGSVTLGTMRVSIRALWPLVFLQFHLAGPKLFWVRGSEFVLR